MYTVMAVAIGGAVGSLLRHGVNHAAARWIGLSFPWGTFFENVVGCALMGVAATWFGQKAGLSPEWRALVATGLLGGFTTFSAFTLDFAQLLGQGLIGRAALYFGATLALAVLGFYLGAAVTKLALS
jgi:CrcB protein